MYRKSRHNKNIYRLFKQIAQFKAEKLRLRPKSYVNVTFDAIYWDYPIRAKAARSWKQHRKTQYKITEV